MAFSKRDTRNALHKALQGIDYGRVGTRARHDVDQWRAEVGVQRREAITPCHDILDIRDPQG
jgi:hypothetical protein